MNESRMSKRILVAMIYATRRRGRARWRWMDQVVEGRNVMGVKE